MVTRFTTRSDVITTNFSPTLSRLYGYKAPSMRNFPVGYKPLGPLRLSLKTPICDFQCSESRGLPVPLDTSYNSD